MIGRHQHERASDRGPEVFDLVEAGFEPRPDEVPKEQQPRPPVAAAGREPRPGRSERRVRVAHRPVAREE